MSLSEAKFGVRSSQVVIYIFGGKIWGSNKTFQRQNLGPSPPSPDMEVPPWEFTSGVKDVTFVLTYI